MERMDAQHAEVAAAIGAVEAELPAWTVSADAATGERIAGTLEAVLPVLDRAPRRGGAELLPVVATTVTQAEWDQLGKHGLASIRPKRRLVILGHILEETDESERARFLRKVPPPARLAYRLVGRRQHAAGDRRPARLSAGSGPAVAGMTTPRPTGTGTGRREVPRTGPAASRSAPRRPEALHRLPIRTAAEEGNDHAGCPGGSRCRFPGS